MQNQRLALASATLAFRMAYSISRREPLAEKISKLYEKRANLYRAEGNLQKALVLLAKAENFTPSSAHKAQITEKQVELIAKIGEQSEQQGNSLRASFNSSFREKYLKGELHSGSGDSSSAGGIADINAIHRRISQAEELFSAAVCYAEAAISFNMAGEDFSLKGDYPLSISNYEKACNNLTHALMICRTSLQLPAAFPLPSKLPSSFEGKITVGVLEAEHGNILEKLRELYRISGSAPAPAARNTP